MVAPITACSRSDVSTGAYLRRGLEPVLLGPGVERAIVVDQQIDGVAQVVVAAREILEPDGKN
ncbi:hypothetical protein ACRQ5Q_01115 [Bradyrhizobium sp. PMVTL-01]|uniref:hypothetical protein n=1 Tax=unclassified Bradyrhizobium TaxID=2631580 RepID=UPI003F6F13DE